MQALEYQRLLRLSSVLVILNQETASTTSWVLNAEQREVLQALCENQRTIILKGRQVGVSTVCCLYDLAFAIANPGINVCICADVQDNANQLLKKIVGWCAQLGIKLTTNNVESITLANGSTIDAKSAVSPAEGKESRVGRSRTYLLFHITELAFWNNDVAVFRSLTSGATSPHVRMVVESTASAADNLFRAMWAGEANGWRHLWLSIEKHETYRAPATTIDDRTWAHLQALGFTIRESGAWWSAKVRADFNGDEQGGLREYPINPEDCFAFAEGRWLTTHIDAEPRYAGVWSDDGRIYRGWTYYSPLAKGETSVAGVDVGAGLDADASTIAVKSRRDGRLLATFTDNTVSIPRFQELIVTVAERFHCVGVRVEKNGVGEGVVSYLRERTACPVVAQQTNGGEKHARMARLKMMIESGEMPVGKEVVAEMMNSRVLKPRSGSGVPVYDGRDDIINALTFAQKQLDEEHMEPAAPPPPPDVRDVFIPSYRQKKRARV